MPGSAVPVWLYQDSIAYGFVTPVAVTVTRFPPIAVKLSRTS